MMSWVLVIYIYAGPLAKGDSVTLATIPMATQATCAKAAEEASTLTVNSTKLTRTVCLKVGER